MRLIILILIFTSSCVSAHEKEGSYFISVTKITNPVNDLGKASLWYAKVLHLEPEDQDDKSVKFKVGDVELVFTKSSERYPPQSAVIYWQVEDVEQDLARLLKLGATLKKPLTINFSGKKEAVVTDPFGNVIGISELTD
ncbi:Glyoxalase/Bleomycin resistance protein/Dioxygenase superfamily protein [Arsukibacterium tuosuense]|uniref:Glyoxalase/Bleomycin resistance protein/Dioxygenase superfamily protein n=1 Tax=Arsukibacterium tuosuense TaxID=1323745 RepID=A0A285JHS1_9GAMM|nr:VOC family protein [Arsukibacterium tuosuense]SNY58671.1 Glyoxalase/Bleomycin resistance protein/Dioxygenase superfamily protein [Arsukibacterium tuosuense]